MFAIFVGSSKGGPKVGKVRFYAGHSAIWTPTPTPGKWLPRGSAAFGATLWRASKTADFVENLAKTYIKQYISKSEFSAPPWKDDFSHLFPLLTKVSRENKRSLENP